MARGKHAAAKANRDAKARRDTIQSLWDELQDQRTRRIEAETAAATATDLEALIISARTEAAHAAQPRLAAIERELAELHEIVREADRLHTTLSKGWNTLLKGLIDLAGGGPDAVSAVASLVTGRNANMRSSTVHAGLRNRDAYRAVARGVETREKLPDLASARQRGMRAETLQAFIPDDVDALIREVCSDQERAKLDDRSTEQAATRAAETADKIADDILSTVDSYSVANVTNHARSSLSISVMLWHPSPWTRHGWLDDNHPLGTVTTDPDATTWLRSREGLTWDRISDADWERLGQRDADIAFEARRARTPIEPLPVHPRPVDAVGLRRLYSFDLQGRVLGANPDMPISSQWTDTYRQLADTATRDLLTAIPFWLPPKQTAGFAASEPLPEGDIADLKLPYPHTLIICADPLEIPATSEPSDEHEQRQISELLDGVRVASRDVRRATDQWDNLSRKKKADETTPTQGLLSATVRSYWHHPLALTRILELFGALVEGVMFSATDEEGTVADGFLWCLAIPSPDGRTLIGRVTVPALLSRTSWHTEVTNLLAAVSWGDWHEPTDTATGDAQQRLADRLAPTGDPRTQAAGGGDVHILNVKASGSQIETSPGDPDDNTEKRTVRPHLRRGHYRRQHYGPRNVHVKRIRVAPKLVNASLTDLSPTVYRLPMNVSHVTKDVTLTGPDGHPPT